MKRSIQTLKFSKDAILSEKLRVEEQIKNHQHDIELLKAELIVLDTHIEELDNAINHLEIKDNASQDKKVKRKSNPS